MTPVAVQVCLVAVEAMKRGRVRLSRRTYIIQEPQSWYQLTKPSMGRQQLVLTYYEICWCPFVHDRDKRSLQREGSSPDVAILRRYSFNNAAVQSPGV